MFAIGHASTALAVQRAYPEIPLAPLLVSVQAVELLWVALNFLGIEKVATDATVSYVGDIHLQYMPYSHSLATTGVLCAAVWLAARAADRPQLGAALALGLASHLLLDVLTHDPDIAIAPFIEGPKLGTGLYSTAPAAAFIVELGWATACWAIYRGRGVLLGVVVFFSLVNASFFFRTLPGPERWLAGRPMLLVTLILAQIVLTLAAVGWAAGPRRRGNA